MEHYGLSKRTSATPETTCDNCGDPLRLDEAVALWNYRYRAGLKEITAFLVVHHRYCDGDDHERAAACAYGPDWNADRHLIERVGDAVFTFANDRERFLEIVRLRREQRRLKT